MSDIAITVEQIAGIEPHLQADRLEIAKILGTQCVVPKGVYQVGFRCIYFPPDICLPADVSAALGVDKYLKTALFEGVRIPCKVAACRLRGTPSYGFVAEVPPELSNCEVGADVTEHYRAAKYEPPVRVYGGHGGGTGEVWGNLFREPENFHHYTDIQAYWKHHKEFEDGILVRVTEKIHGTNSRVGLLKVGDEWDFYAGSHKKCRRWSDHEGREC